VAIEEKKLSKRIGYSSLPQLFPLIRVQQHYNDD